jgi:hypothetical protein
MILRCLGIALLVMWSSAWAQQMSSPGQAEVGKLTDNLFWEGTLHDRLSQMKDPVVLAYSQIRLAALVCSQDKAAGAKLLSGAFTSVRDLPEDAFDISPTLLPVSSLTALSKILVQAAQLCAVSWYDDRVSSRVSMEWMKSNGWLNQALRVQDLNRAAQLADAAIFVARQGNSIHPWVIHYSKLHDETTPGTQSILLKLGIPPEILQLPLIGRVLKRLSVVAPDLADDLFRTAVQTIMSESPPTALELAELARYLLPTESYIQVPLDSRVKTDPPGILAIPNFMQARLKTSIDLVIMYMDSASQLVQSYETTAVDAAGAYALAYQMLPIAREYARQQESALESALQVLEPQLGERAVKIRAALGSLPQPHLVQSDFMLVGKAVSDVQAGRFSAARKILSDVDDSTVRKCTEALISFGEISTSITTRDAERALEQPIYASAGGGRALLYAAIARAVGNSAGASRALQLALRDANALPPHQSVCVLPALASLALQVDTNQAVDILKRLVKTENDATDGSRSLDMDSTADSVTEDPYFRCGAKGPLEVVDTRDGRQVVPLHIPGVSTYTIDAFLEQADAAEFSRLESVVLELRDETQLANALLTIASLKAATQHQPIKHPQ